MISDARAARLKVLLDDFVDQRPWVDRLAKDPLEFPHRYSNPRDVEVVAMLSASLAYGRADLFKPKIQSLLDVMGAAPAKFVSEINVKDAAAFLKRFVYRFNVGADVATLLLGMGAVLREFGSMEALYLSCRARGDEGGHWRFHLVQFSQAILSAAPKREIRKHLGPTRGLSHLLPTAGVGPAKRQNLLLRWLVRGPDAIDLGVWKKVDPATLIIPLDTHVARISKWLGFTNRSDVSWRTADEVTAGLRKLDPKDPTKYDFALCHYGMSGACPVAPRREICVHCELKAECVNGRKLPR